MYGKRSFRSRRRPSRPLRSRRHLRRRSTGKRISRYGVSRGGIRL